MNINIINWMKETRSLLPYDLGHVLDVGSLNVNGSAREVYTQFVSYTGIDIRAGKDVDIVMNGHDLVKRFGENSIDTLVCMSTLEHDDAFWLTVKAINTVLKKGGFHIFSVPTIGFPIHNHPGDYWRLTEQAIREIILDGYEVLDLKKISTKILDEKPINHVTCAIGRRKL